MKHEDCPALYSFDIHCNLIVARGRGEKLRMAMKTMAVRRVSIPRMRVQPNKSQEAAITTRSCVPIACALGAVIPLVLALLLVMEEFRPFDPLPSRYLMPATSDAWMQLASSWKASPGCRSGIQAVVPSLCGKNDPNCARLRQQLADSPVHDDHSWDSEVPTSWDYGLQRSFLSGLLRTWERFALAPSRGHAPTAVLNTEAAESLRVPGAIDGERSSAGGVNSASNTTETFSNGSNVLLDGQATRLDEGELPPVTARSDSAPIESSGPPMLQAALLEFESREACVLGSTVHMFALDNVAVRAEDLERLLRALTPPVPISHSDRIVADRARVLKGLSKLKPASHGATTQQQDSSGDAGQAVGPTPNEQAQLLRAQHSALLRTLRHEAQLAGGGASAALLTATPALHSLQGAVSSLAFDAASRLPKAASARRPLLLLLHGWPSGPSEYLPVLRLLRNLTRSAQTGPSAASSGVVLRFDAVVPALPGFGRSQPLRSSVDAGAGVMDDGELWQLRRRGPDAVDLAHWTGALARTLGYVPWEGDAGEAGADGQWPGYYVSGGDYGGLVGSVVAQTESPANLRGVHLSMWPVQARRPSTLLRTALSLLIPAGPFRDAAGEWGLSLSALDTARLGNGSLLPVLSAIGLHSGYLHQQTTFPDTLAIALESSPTAAAAWVVDKFIAWQQRCFDAREQAGSFSGPGDCLMQLYPLAELLLVLHDHVASPRAPVRLYRDALRSPRFLPTVMAPVTAPVALLDLAEETLFRMPDGWAGDKYTQVRQRGSLTRSGHFAGLVEPEGLTADVLRFMFAREAARSRSPGPAKQSKNGM